jgi:hypothetical protein
MLRRIKTAFREVDPPYKSDGIIHHHDLLVMTGPHGMMSVETKVKSPVCSPAQLKDGKDLAIQGKDHGKIPVQNMGMEATTLRNDRIEKRAKLLRQLIRRSVTQQTDPAVDIPPNNKNGFPSPSDGHPKCGKIRCTINQEGGTLGWNNTPAIPSFDEKPCASLFSLTPGTFG